MDVSFGTARENVPRGLEGAGFTPDLWGVGLGCAFAEFERALIRERQLEGIALARARGACTGRKPSLTPGQAEALRARAAAGEPKAGLAREFGISRQTPLLLPVPARSGVIVDRPARTSPGQDGGTHRGLAPRIPFCCDGPNQAARSSPHGEAHRGSCAARWLHSSRRSEHRVPRAATHQEPSPAHGPPEHGNAAGDGRERIFGAARDRATVEAIGESLRHELHPWGISVSVVEPGAIKTAIWDKARRDADRLEHDLPDAVRTQYAAHVAAIRKDIDMQDRRGADPGKVAKAVEHALFSQRPKTRYLVGTDAKVQSALVRWLPARPREAIIRRIAGP